MSFETESKSPFEFAIGKEQKEKISEILSEVSKLTNLEQWCLYLRLPSCPVVDERIKSPVKLDYNNPASSLSSPSAKRTLTTLNWLQSNYEEDRRVCVPKQEVYNQYRSYCESNGFTPVATSDFGKIVKTAFPNVHDRRLGQRGKSKYCYGGIKQKSSSDEAEVLPEEQACVDPVEELEVLSSQLVCEWASSLLGKNFTSLRSLAQYLVFSGASCGKKAALFNMLIDSWGSSNGPSEKKNWSSQLPDRQALVQRKLLQKEVLKEHKNLLKRQEQNQQNVRSGQASTVPRLAVLSPSINHQPSTLHVLNFTGTSIPSIPPIPTIPPIANLVLGQDNTGAMSNPNLQDFCGSTSLPDSSVNWKKSDNIDFSDSSVQNIPTTPVSDCDRSKVKDKLAKLISSRSLEDGGQRQPKRNYDTLHNTSQGRDTKRRRCITSLGVKEFQGQRGANGQKGNSENTGQIRPVSCPVFLNNLEVLDCSMESEDVNTSEPCPTPPRSEPEVANSVKVSSASDVSSDTDSVSSSFHFVCKPKVISIKTTSDRPDTSVNASTDNLSDSCSDLESPVKKSHHILNSILSLSESNLSHRVSTAEQQVISTTQSLNRLNPGLLSHPSENSAFAKRDNNKSEESDLHSFDSTNSLPRQPNRSAFVPVLNGKGSSDSSRLDIPSQLGNFSSDDLSSSPGSTSQTDTSGTRSPRTHTYVLEQALKTVEVSERRRRREEVDDCEPMSSSISKSSTFSSTDIGFTSVSNKTRSSTSSLEISVTPTKLVSVSDDGQRKTPCMTSPVMGQQRRMSAKSPVTPPKRPPKSRFTPIRPKLGVCSSNASPQKKDMRPVSTILREQRARSAQELLVNLASSYQGGLQVAAPQELLVMTSPDKPHPPPPTQGEASAPSPIPPRPRAPCLSGKENITVLVETATASSMNNNIPTLVSPVISRKMLSPIACHTLPSSPAALMNMKGVQTVSCSGSSPSICPLITVPSSVPSSVDFASQTRPALALEPQVVVADAKGAVYNLDREAVNPSQNTPSLQMLLQANPDNKTSPRIQPKQNVIKMSDLQGHLVGPDASGQTYLLVPNSVPTPVAVSSVMASSNFSPSINSTMSSSTLPNPTHPIPSRSSGLQVASSSALLSELSHLAGGCKQDKNKQPIQHDSANSAFQKCEPNKASLIVPSDQSLMFSGDLMLDRRSSSAEATTVDSNINSSSVLQPDKTLGKEQVSKEHSEGLDQGEHTIRKRKASKSQDEKSSENKRQNTKSSKEMLLDIDDSQCTLNNKEEEKCSIKEPDLKDGDSDSLSRSEDAEVSDTDTLLDMISKSRSMTVKETVLAMNSLRARMHVAGTVSVSPGMACTRGSTSTLVSPVEGKIANTSSANEEKELIPPSATQPQSRMESSTDAVKKEKIEVANKIASHVIRRNTSLNLESLESDALLDTELFLDRHLVEDMKTCHGMGVDNKNSVAVKSQSSSAKIQKTKRKDTNIAVTISPKALHSYMILNERCKSGRERGDNGKDISHTMKENEYQSMRGEMQEDNKRLALHQEPGPDLAPLRSVSSVKEILEHGLKMKTPAGVPAGQISEEKVNFSEVDAFDALLSKMHSKALPTGGMGVRSHSSCLEDSEIPGDIVDFVTESMTSRKMGDSSTVYQSTLSPTDSLDNSKARSVSVPNTKADFLEMGPTHNMSSSSSESSSLSPNESLSQLSSRPSPVDSSAFKENTAAKNVFLSPVGPAKLARRSSVEKCTAQSQVDKAGMRSPAETASVSSQPASTKEKSAFAANQKLQCVERRHTKTPVDRSLMYTDPHQNQPPFMNLQFSEKHRQEEHITRQSPVNRTQTKTPIDKFFMKQSHDPHLSGFSLPSQKSTMAKEESSFIPTPASDSGCSGGDSISNTPSSEHSQAGVGGAPHTQTPSSDWGYSSVSPSPVMMSSAGYVGECGRNLSPATIFMPLRSDSALSVSNSQVMRSDSPSSSAQNAQAVLDRLSEFLNHIQNEPMGNLSYPSDPLLSKLGAIPKESPSAFTSDLPDIPSILKSLNSKPSSESNSEMKDDKSKEMKSRSDSKSLLKLLSSSLQGIPTPPVSPSASPPAVTSSNTPCYPPGIPIFLASHHPENSSSPPSLVSDFLLPSASSISCMSTVGHDPSHQLSPSPHFGSRDLPSPAMVARGYTPSPQIPTRPPSSPHHFSSPHPSPPFTPCSLRSLPSPRCLTPCSHKSLVSPRSVTPSSDPTQAPNRFMPIQSSGILPVSHASPHTYIQPIKPVVALASASRNSSHPSNPKALNSVSKGGIPYGRKISSLKNPQGMSLMSHHHSPLSPSQSAQLSTFPAQEPDCINAVRVSEHKPLSENSTVVLSLPGDISSFSPRNECMQWATRDIHHKPDSSEAKPGPPDRPTIVRGRKAERLLQQAQRKGRAMQQHIQDNPPQANELFTSSRQYKPLPSNPNMPNPAPYHPRPQPQISPSARHGKGNGPTNPHTTTPRDQLGSRPSSYERTAPKITHPSPLVAGKPFTPSSSALMLPSSKSAPVCSFMPVLESSNPHHHPHLLPPSQHMNRAMAGPPSVRQFDKTTRMFSSLHHKPDGMVTSHPIPHPRLHRPGRPGIETLYPAGQDELQVTLDVLKNMDSHYFQCDEDTL